MAADDGNEIFILLEKNLRCAIERDYRYKRENDAKMRALNQRVATYEDFRNHVLAAHLSPLEKKDHLKDGCCKTWNSYAASKSGSKHLSVSQMSKVATPTTIQEFQRRWHHQTDPKARYNLLKEVGVEDWSKFGVCDQLGETLLALQTFPTGDHDFVLSALKCVCEDRRFRLSLHFLSSEERAAGEKIRSKLEEISCDNQSFKHLPLFIPNQQKS